jgi:DNA-damage-inducible protein J
MCYKAILRKSEAPMAKTATIRARVEPALKRDAEAVLKRIGLTSSEAINLFFTQVRLQKGLPFALRVPNRQTLRAIRDASMGTGFEEPRSFAAWAKKVRSI